MFFRFGSALVLIVVTSLFGILVEKQNLTLRRELSRQHYRMDVLQEEHARLRLQSQQLAAVARLFETIDDKDSGLTPVKPGSTIQLFDAGPSSENDSTDPTVENPEPRDPDSSDLTTRRVPLLFWQKPVSDPRMTRD